MTSTGIRIDRIQIKDIDDVTPQQLADWLSDGKVVEYCQITLWPPEEDEIPFIVMGTDAYGIDFGAGDIRAPNRVMENLKYKSDQD